MQPIDSIGNSVSFLDFVNMAFELVTPTYPDAQLLVAEVSISEPGNPTALSALTVKFFVQNGHVTLASEKWGSYGPISFDPRPVSDCHVIPWPLKMDLVDADVLLKRAGYDETYSAITLRQPIRPHSEPYYIFYLKDNKTVLIGVADGSVTLPEHAINEHAIEGPPPIVWPWGLENGGSAKHIDDVTASQFWLIRPPGNLNPILVVAAEGHLYKTEWTNLRLVERVYITNPIDGILDLDFIGEPPPSRFSPLHFPVAAEITLRPPPWLLGVRVHARLGSVESVANAVSNTLADAEILVDLSNASTASSHNLSPIWRQKILSWKDPTTPPHITQKECVKWAYPWPHSKICVGYKYKTQWLYGNLWLTIKLNRPEDIQKQINDSLHDAQVVAGASLVLEVVATGGVTLENAITSFGETFKASLAARLAGSLVSVAAKNDPSWGNYE